MENLVKGNVVPTNHYLDRYQYLETLDDPRVLIEEKQAINEFITKVKMEEISVKSIEKLQKSKSKNSKPELVTLMTEESKEDDKPKEHEYAILDTSTNILGIKWSERVGKMLAHYVGKYSKGENTNDKEIVSIVHYCLPQNKNTYDSYYIVKNIISSILNKCPEILCFFKLLDLDVNIDIFYNDSETLKRDYTEIFIRFMKKLKELKLDYNIVVFISQADCAYVKNNLNNFFFLLRHAVSHFPPYIKFIMTFTSESIIEIDETSRILFLHSSTMQTEVKNDLHLASRDLFEKYSSTVIDLIQIPDGIDQAEFISKCDNDFEKLLDFIEMKDLDINPMEIINKYDLNLASYISGINNSAKDPTKYINIIRILSHLKMPVEIETLSALWEIEESELLSTIHNDLNSIVWTFKKRSSPHEAIEEDKYDDVGDENIYVVVNSINYFEYENSVEVHNEIVKLLRK